MKLSPICWVDVSWVLVLQFYQIFLGALCFIDELILMQKVSITMLLTSCIHVHPLNDGVLNKIMLSRPIDTFVCLVLLLLCFGDKYFLRSTVLFVHQAGRPFLFSNLLSLGMFVLYLFMPSFFCFYLEASFLLFLIYCLGMILSM